MGNRVSPSIATTDRITTLKTPRADKLKKKSSQKQNKLFLLKYEMKSKKIKEYNIKMIIVQVFHF